jgi:hypothetical protein
MFAAHTCSCHWGLPAQKTRKEGAMGRRVSWIWLPSVLILTTSGVVSAQNANMGTTFDALQASASTITTTFADNCVASTHQDRPGLFVTEVRQSDAPTSRADLRLTFSTLTKRLSIGGAETESIELSTPATYSIALDWLNAQACSLARDVPATGRPIAPSALIWRDGLYHPRETGPSPAMDVKQMSARVRRVTADFPAFSVVTSVTDAAVKGTVARGAYAFESVVTPRNSNLVVGRVRWFPGEQILAFSYPDYTRSATIGPKNVGRALPFDPNPAWGTTQAYAFIYFLQQRAMARDRAGLAAVAAIRPWRELIRRPAVITASVRPSFRLAQAEGDGCTYLWWLNDTLYRPCCDSHDYCYTYGSCNWETWWAWTGLFPTWQCTTCNLAVVGCFFDTTCMYTGGMYCI